MALTDSISVFAEGTPEEQVQELVDYLVRGRSDEDREALVREFAEAIESKEGQKPFNEDDERRRQVFSRLLSEVKGLGDGNEKEIDGFFNMIYAHIFALYPLDSSEITEHVKILLQVISSASTDKPSRKYRILSNLFNAIPRTSHLRSLVYATILEIATDKDELEVLNLSRSTVEKWLSEWDISNMDKAAFAKTVADGYVKCDQREKAYEYSLTSVRLLPAASAESHAAAFNLIADALRLPSVFNFDPLIKLDVVVAVKNHELFSLLQIFLNNGLAEFQTWLANHPDTLKEYDLDKSHLERKIRLLTLTSLSFKYIGQDLPYSKISETLQIDLAGVETWIIDVIRAGLVWGKMSQTNQALHVVRSTARVFEKEQWETLEKRVLAWKTTLTGVLDVVATAKRHNGIITPPQAA
ncbi:hypothetical protein M378DRAFT_156420 [Amanita muscaria Koide BX008]|uniref:Eukaryotic translation initiation factor 3 subunit M n=1 Tax=Amanita muscaria (strain Koide BX008) TaxID=946122 RepID=A0A0C2XME2_AMAMK|nr:hypothetical protein M378DRAFT_156420 [Amanita muscaria Koide BX008]